MARRQGGRQSYSPCRQPKKPQSHRQDGQVSTGPFGELVKEMNESVSEMRCLVQILLQSGLTLFHVQTKKRNKERQKLQDNHRSRVQKVEAGILDLVHAKRSHLYVYKAFRMPFLKTQITVNI